MTQGKVDIAVEFAQHGAKLLEKAAGPEHPVTPSWRSILGMVVSPRSKAITRSLNLTARQEMRFMAEGHKSNLLY